MKLRLRLHDTRETLKLELADTGTVDDLRRLINPVAPFSVHLSLNRKDELLVSSPDDTLRSLGVTSGDLIYYSLVQSDFDAGVQGGEPSNCKLDDYETLTPQSESNQAVVHDSMGIGFAEVDSVTDQPRSDLNSGEEVLGEGSKGGNSGKEGPEPMDIEQLDVETAGSKRLSVPFFLKNILVEKSGDTTIFTTLALSVHAVMLESGFLLLDHGSDKFSFSNNVLSVPIRYTLPELITRKDSNAIESVTLRFQNLGPSVVVYGSLGGSGERVHMTYLDKRSVLQGIDLVMETLKNNKEGSSSFYREVFMFWRMVKDKLVIPLLIGLCDKAGLDSPPCLMLLPTDLKMKILELLPGVSVGIMACVCTEMCYLASDNDLWQKKFSEEAKDLVSTSTGNWKDQFAAFWRQQKRVRLRESRHFPARGINPLFHPMNIRDPRDRRGPSDPFNPFDRRGPGDPFFNPFDRRGRGPFRMHMGPGLAGVTWGQRFTRS